MSLARAGRKRAHAWVVASTVIGSALGFLIAAVLGVGLVAGFLLWLFR